MFRALVNFAAIGALPLEHGAGVMQTMGQHMQRGLAPRHELAVVPDHPLEAVIRFLCHGDSVLILLRRGVTPGMFCSDHESARGPRVQSVPRVRSFRNDRLLDNNLSEICQYG